MDRWLALDSELLDVKERFDKINAFTHDDIQMVFDEIYLLDIKPISYTKREKLQRYIDTCKEKGIFSEYVIFMANKILARKNMYQQDILELKLLLIYDNQYKQYDKVSQDAFVTILNSGYSNCTIDIKETLNEQNLLILLPLALKKVNSGYIYKDYISSRIQYDAEQIKKQALINNQQNKELNVENYEFEKILELQNKLNLNIKKKEDSEELKFSGFLEVMSTSIYHTGYLKACENFNVKEVQYVATVDDRTTKVCKSMHTQVFKINDTNEYYRYNEEVGDIILTKTKGLVPGINLPPITTTYHPCRSTIVAIKNNNKQK